MIDRLEEIKERYGWTPSLEECTSFDVYESDLDDHAPDFSWLISEVERLRARDVYLQSELKAAATRYVGGWPE
ncbi:MAG: hypothetical protein ACE3JK_10560 [Sporolactobacillus sp.]